MTGRKAKEDADYITSVSDIVKELMRDQMAEDSMRMYGVDNTDIPGLNFETIMEEISFYLNENSDPAICLIEGNVTPCIWDV